MTPEQKARWDEWLGKLRATTLRKLTGNLYNTTWSSETEVCACCILGSLNPLMGTPRRGDSTEAALDFHDLFGVWPNFDDDIETGHYRVEGLIDLNDGTDLTFPEMAEVLEANVGNLKEGAY